VRTRAVVDPRIVESAEYLLIIMLSNIKKHYNWSIPRDIIRNYNGTEGTRKLSKV